MKLVSVKDLENEQRKISLINTLKNLVCRDLLEFVDIQIESFMYPNDPKRFPRIFKDNKISNEASDKESKVKNYPLSLGIGHSALFPLIYIRQKTNSLLSQSVSKRTPTALVDDLIVRFKNISDIYSSLNKSYHAYLAVDHNNISHQKLLADVVTQSDFLLDILHRYATVASSVAQDSEDANTLVYAVNRLIEDTNLFYKRIINNSNAYVEYNLIKHDINRNRSEETLVELEFKTLDVSEIHLDDEFHDFLQHRKISLKISQRRVI
ncbi:YGL117W [Saccharomyces arboricola H-6]|uniref:YGL117W n=1 Tax=Saccharomyces arboricola (strain H-6 / AS 2.3317 / CBS 10644) TaxID=1160507 RepID=J8Q286_SACAR|nr:YGL117W [Saccharomyces arboricola H-6]